MKMLWSSVLLLAAAVMVLAGCGNWPGSLSKEANAIVGRWTCQEGPITTRLVLNSDGTCEKTVDVALAGKPVKEIGKGTWWLDESILNMELTMDSGDPRKETSEIKLSNGSLTVNDAGHAMIFRGSN